jgi:hypothetical protein
MTHEPGKPLGEDAGQLAQNFTEFMNDFSNQTLVELFENSSERVTSWQRATQPRENRLAAFAGSSRKK